MILGLWGFIQLTFIFWLWYFYDRQIRNIHNKLINIPEKINEEFRGRGATSAGIAPHIVSRERPLKIHLKKLQFDRGLFLERVQLIFSIKRKL